MSKVIIILDVDDEFADRDHEMGITEEAHMRLTDTLSSLGDIIDIRRGSDDD